MVAVLVCPKKGGLMQVLRAFNSARLDSGLEGCVGARGKARYRSLDFEVLDWDPNPASPPLLTIGVNQHALLASFDSTMQI